MHVQPLPTGMRSAVIRSALVDEALQAGLRFRLNDMWIDNLATKLLLGYVLCKGQSYTVYASEGGCA